ncbi:MAG: bifunctional glutamate N-acetyltransferase/amino-acid acetyltransferase ArgJ [Alphaproteobacteria bacterium]
MAKKSPLAPARFPDLPCVSGVRLGAFTSGIRHRRGRADLMLAELAPGTAVAGIFTRSACASAPVEWCRACVKGGKIRALVVNSGNANAFTGKAGEASVGRTVDRAAKLFGCPKKQIFVASTGVIGVPLPDRKITGALPKLAARGLSANGWEAAARAIMTTDTFPKGAARRASIAGKTVTITGIAKGSGMIAPDMATMLAFIFTDAAIPAKALNAALSAAAEKSFNAITVDSDTSTSDTVLLCATGRGQRHKRVTGLSDRHWRDFRRKLEEVMVELAHQVVRDGEGASKFVTITVTGAAGARAARRIGLAIANSPLVKTAIAGADANWGRIVMAVGKSGEKAERERLGIRIGGVQITENGMVRPGYDEAPVAAHMKGRDIDIEVDVGANGGRGRGRATVWTCDLTHGYIDINASYRS